MKTKQLSQALTLLVLIAFGTGSASAQLSPDKCVEHVKAFSTKMNDISFPDEGKVFYFHYQNHIDLWDAEAPAQDLEVKILMSNDQVHYLTDEVDVYQDERDALMVIHPKKLVVWSTSTPTEDRETRLKEITQIREKLYEVAEATGCHMVPAASGQKVFQLDMEVKPEFRSKTKVNNVSYWYDMNTARVTKMKTDFTRSYEAKSMTVVYKDMNLDFKADLDDPVLTKVMNRKRQLVSRYKDYQLIDNR